MTVYGGCPITRTQYIQQKQTQTSELNAGLGFFYLNLAHNIHYVIFFIFKKRLDKKRIIVYTNSVSNEKDYITTERSLECCN